MAKGGVRKPTKLKAIEGNRSRVPLPKNEPMPAPVEPKYAYDLLSPMEQEIWDAHYKILEPIGLLTEADGENFANVL